MRERKLLIELRSQLVGKMHVQPFTIYSDATIEALLKAKPKTLRELSCVKGFPKDGKRIKGFGEAVIAIFKDPNSIESIAVKGDSSNISVGVKTKPLEAF